LSATQFTFTLPLIVAGAGLGCTFAPMTTVTMHDVDPRIAGAASGVLNTIRQIGASLGSAVIGAVLQNRLATELLSQAQAQASNLPQTFRTTFVNSFAKAASGGLQVGSGQTGVALPPNIPPQEAALVQRVAHDVFATAFLNAMKPTLAIAIVVLVFGVVLTTALVDRPRSQQVVQQAA
jgi:hypothetical protein